MYCYRGMYTSASYIKFLLIYILSAFIALNDTNIADRYKKIFNIALA